jgi:hypothetical protein
MRPGPCQPLIARDVPTATVAERKALNELLWGYISPRPTGTSGLTRTRPAFSATDSLPIPISRSIPVVSESIAM